MGNSLPLPSICKEVRVATTTASGAKTNKNRPAARNVVVRAAPRHAVVPMDTPEDGGEEEGMKKAWPGCRVEPAGEDGVRVKVVMTRKDAAELMARLQERAAGERKARMGDLNTKLGGGNGNGNGNGGVMSPCRNAWRPRLAVIPEN